MSGRSQPFATLEAAPPKKHPMAIFTTPAHADPAPTHPRLKYRDPVPPPEIDSPLPTLPWVGPKQPS